MYFMKGTLLFLLTFTFLFHTPIASAAPPENELNTYLAEIGLTKEELQEYLDFYEIPLDEFNSVEELKFIIGTPINDENFQGLLTQYNLTETEFHALLDNFGDSIDEYIFIEDLDATVDFYINNDQYMDDIENELADIGITEEETERFFQYLAEVEERHQHQLDQMELLDSRLEKFLDVEDPSELTDEELDELVQILTESIEHYEIQVKFTVANKDISLKDLLRMKDAPENLYVSIFSNTGEPLIDFTVPAWVFESGDVFNDGEDMIHVGELSDEFIDHLHEEKYEDLNKIAK
jgi:processed acidic surface protein